MLVSIAQISPVLLDREATIAKVAASIRRAGERGARLVCFGEALVPGYPVWLSRTDAARFEAPDQKHLQAVYSGQAVTIERGHLDPVRDAARAAGTAAVLGVVERPTDRAGHSLFATRVFIDATGAILSSHRKLVPTHEERLSWSPGDGTGLVTHAVGDAGDAPNAFTVGALNCWENWMPLARAAIYAAGADLIVMLWPGREWNTREITRFVALESRSFVISASATLWDRDIPAGTYARDRFVRSGEMIHDGGSCIAAPDGSWVVEPVTAREDLILADLDPRLVQRERHSFDPAGHYSRPDVLRLIVDRRRQAAAEWVDGS